MRPFALSPALTDTILREFDPENSLRTYDKDGVFYPVPPFTGERLIDFSHPIGPMKVYFVPYGEIRSFPPNLNVKRVFLRCTFTPKDIRLMRSLIEYGFFDNSVFYKVSPDIKETMFALGEKITHYLEDLSSDLLGLQEIGSIEILKMTPGSYNLNFHVRAGQKDIIFRVNINQQSGLSNQVEYEFSVLKFLEGHRIAPQPFLYDDRRECFDFDILIEEYLEGPPLSLQRKSLPEVAELLTRLHGLYPGGMPFVIWQDPLAGDYELINDDLTGYETALSPDKKTISLAKKVLAKSETLLNKQRHLFQANSLIHTDLCCENFVKTASGLRLIDWEKPRVDDGTYDICCFLSEPAELYNSREVLNSEERQYFIEVYAGLSGKNEDHLMEKVNIREPLISLHWILWAATMLSNLREQRTSPELMGAHEEKIARYERVANPENIEKLIEKF